MRIKIISTTTRPCRRTKAQPVNGFPGLNAFFLCLLLTSCASLHKAIDEGNEAEVRRIIESDRGLLEKPVGGYGNNLSFLSPLNYAIDKDKLGLASMLLQMGAPVDRAVSEKDRPAAFYCLLISRPISFCERFLKRVDLKKNEVRALSAAVHNPEGMRYLLDHGISLDTRFDDGSTILFYTFYPAVVRLLLERGARPDIQNNQNETPLHAKCFDDGNTLKLGFGTHAEIRSSIRILYQARPESLKVVDKNYKTPADLSPYCASLANTPTAQPGFSDTVLLKSGETITNVKATVTRDSVIVSDSSGNTRTFTKEQIAGVKTGDR